MSAKTRPEHVMIVDLMRNDVHLACDEVVVERLFETKRYSTNAILKSFRTLEAGLTFQSVAVTRASVRSMDAPLPHKTSRYAPFDAALREARERGTFEGFARSDRGAIADGARTTIFLPNVPSGSLATPPLASGELTGVLRALVRVLRYPLEANMVHATAPFEMR